MKNNYFLSCILGGVCMIISCSNDTEIKNEIPVSIGLSSHEILFTEVKDSVTLTAERPWYIEHIYNKNSNEYVYEMSQDNNAQEISSGALRGVKISADGLIIRKYNDHHVDFFDNGMLPTDTFSVFCRLAPFNHYSESIMITKRKE